MFPTREHKKGDFYVFPCRPGKSRLSPFCSGLSRGNSDAGFDPDESALLGTFSLKNHLSRGGGEQGVIPPQPYITAGVEVSATLPDDDIARHDVFATEALHAQSFGF